MREKERGKRMRRRERERERERTPGRKITDRKEKKERQTQRLEAAFPECIGMKFLDPEK